MKMTKSAFLGQNSGGDMGGQANFSGRVVRGGGDPPSPPKPWLLFFQKNTIFLRTNFLKIYQP